MTTLAERVAAAPVFHDPWTHSVVTNAFSPAIYRSMLKNLPEPLPNVKPLSEMSSKRFPIWLIPDKGNELVEKDFWRNVRDHVAEPLREAVEDKFMVRGSRTGMALVYDEPGYHLKSHTDMPERLVTCVFYLAVNGFAHAQGTVLMRSSTPDSTGHSRGGELEDVKVVPYVPNSGLIFPRSDWSFHGVYETTTPRWTLSFDVFR